MLETLDSGADVKMLAVEPPKTRIPTNRRVAKIEGDRYLHTQDSDRKETRHRSYSRKSFDKEFESVRDGAENRSIQRGGFVQKKPKISPQLDMPKNGNKKEEFHVARNHRGEYHASSVPKGNIPEVLAVDNVLWKKKSRSKPKKGVLKDAPDSLSIRVRQNSSGQKDLYSNFVITDRSKARLSETRSNGLVPEKPSFERHVRDSSSYIDYSTAKKEEDDMVRRRLASAARPKSAGQAMYVSGDMSDSDDSFYDGEIEIVDLDDPVFAYEREFEESRNTGKTNRSSAAVELSPNYSQAAEPCSDRISGFPDDARNKGKQTLHTSESGSGLNRESSQSDCFDSYSMPPRPPTARGRRRAQSEPEVEPLTVVKKNETRKTKQTFNVDKRLYRPLVRESPNNTCNPVDKVISRYSSLSVQKKTSNFPKQVLDPRTDTHIPHAPLPRKLKPILRRDREKVGQSRNGID